MEAVAPGDTRARAGLNWRPSSGADYASLATRSVSGLTLRLRCRTRRFDGVVFLLLEKPPVRDWPPFRTKTSFGSSRCAACEGDRTSFFTCRSSASTTLPCSAILSTRSSRLEGLGETGPDRLPAPGIVGIRVSRPPGGKTTAALTYTAFCLRTRDKTADGFACL